MAREPRALTAWNAFNIFWRISGTDTKLLVKCPQQEQAKFTLIGVLILATGAASGLLARYVTLHDYGDDYYVRAYFLLVIVFFTVLSLLQAGCRILRSTAGKKNRSGAIKMPSATFFYIILLFPIVAGLVYAVERLGWVGPEGVAREVYMLYGGFGWALLIPGIIVLLWPSPVYDALVAQARFDGPEMPPIARGEKDAPGPKEISPENLRLESELQELFDLDPTNINIAHKLIAIRRQMNKIEGALQVYDTLISHDPANVELIKEKAELYEEIGDQRRYAKTIVIADRMLAQASFEENLGKKIILNKMEIKDLKFFGNFKWEFNPQVNVLLGKNGYGKSHLLRILVAILQAEDVVTETFFYDVGKNPMIKVDIEKDGIAKSTIRKRLVFEESYGKVPVLAIPDMRYIDKSGETVGAPREEIADLRSQSAWHFIHEKSYEGLILQFLYDLCLDYLEHKSWDLPIFNLIQETMKKLADASFTFHKIVRKDSANFTILVLTDGNENHPLPIQKASQGTLSLLAIVGLTYKFLKKIYADFPESDLLQQHAIVVIDEIGAHLHPSWQQKIVQIFRDTFPNIQFIVTAHSPLVVAGCKKGEVAVLDRKSDGFTVEVLNDHFIGATSEYIYRRIFEVEEKDPSYKRLNTLIGQKSEIEKEIARYSNRDDLNPKQREDLEDLQDKLYYLREFDEIRKKKKEEEQLSSQYVMLKQESMQMRGEISKLKKQLAEYENQRSPEQAQVTEKWLQETLDRYPEQTAPVEEYANFLADNGRTEEAIMVLEGLHQVQPDNIDLIKTLATQYQVQSEFDKAATLLQRAVKIAPDDQDLQVVFKRINQIIER